MTATTYLSGLARQANVANYLTAMRAVLFLPAVLCFYFGLHWMSFAIVLVAGLTDWLDGHLARRWQLLTPLGRVGDPLADKLFVNFTLLPLGFVYQSPSLIILWAVVVAYDTHTTWCRRHEIGRALRGDTNNKPPDLPVSQVSKAKTAFLFALLVYGYLPGHVNLYGLEAMALLALSMVLFSWVKHLKMI